MTIFEIQEKLRSEEFEVSLHAFEEAVDDFLSLQDVLTSVLRDGEVLEDDTDDFRCLVCCKCRQNNIHVVFDYYDFGHAINSKIEIVTIYKPDPMFWINYRKRRK